jgi:hypothetical protein
MRPLESWFDWAGSEAAMEIPLLDSLEQSIKERFDLIYGPAHADLDDETKQLGFFSARADRLSHFIAERIGLSIRPFWPGDRPYAVCITHDIDRTLASYHRLRGLRARPFSSAAAFVSDCTTSLIPSMHKLNPFFNFSGIRTLEKELGVLSAFYVLFEKRRWMRSLLTGQIQHTVGVYHPASIADELRAAAAAGNEVGLHASFSSWNDPDKLKEELQDLANLGLKSALGMRTHYLCFDPDVTPTIEVENGLLYDSSVGFNFLVGFRSGTCFPYKLGKIWELPMHLMDTALNYRFPDPLQAKKAALAVQSEVKEVGGVLVLNWHSHLMNPRVHARSLDIFSTLIRNAQKDDAWIALPREIIAFWEARKCRTN